MTGATSAKTPRTRRQRTPRPGPEEGATYLELYRRMLLIRGFEELVQSLFLKGEVHGTTHLYSGQEANATGVASVLGDKDYVAGTYRGHGYALAVGVDPQALLDEMLGRSTGVCGGRAGSMNVIDLSHGLLGSFGIIGGSMGAAVGAAITARRDGGVAVAFFGDGATNHGYFHECLNFAKVNGLPVLFYCENNRYGEFTPFENVTAGEIADRPAVLGIESHTIDGMDIWSVRDAAAAAVGRMRNGEGPQFIQAMTYRFVGHSRSDPARYRKPGELEEWKLRDPLAVARAGLIDRYGLDVESLDRVDGEVASQLAEIRERGLGAPYPSAQDNVTAREFAPD
jgi:TPP-dependent pyruvate/acetoin dehydrogenase alpha subunit